MENDSRFSWLTEGPVDYELKKYKMLAMISRMKKSLDNFHVWKVIEEVEEQLDHLYKTKYEMEILDDSNKIAKDIDFFNFEIIYETLQNEASIEHRIVDDIVDEAIVEFGDLYMESRKQWREIEELINLTWIPQKPRVLNRGYVIIVFNGFCNAYEFEKPSKMSNSWRNVKLKEVKNFKFSNDAIVKFYDDYQDEDETLMFARIGVTSDSLPYEEAVLPVSKSILFNRLVTDFA